MKRIIAITLFFPVYIGVLLLFTDCSGHNSSSRYEQPRMQYEYDVNTVDTIVLHRTAFKRQIVSNGRLAAIRKAELSFSTAGVISSIKVINGSSVGKGSVIAELDSRDAGLRVESARISFQKAELDMYDLLVGLGYKARDTVSVPPQILESAKMQSGYFAAKSEYERAVYNLKTYRLTAPFAGKIADISKREYEQSSGIFCNLIDDRELYIDFPVMASEMSMCGIGTNVKVLPYTDSRSCYGRIVSINPTINESGQLTVRALLANNIGLLDGQDVKVLIEKDIPGQLVVPKNAVVIRDNKDVIFTYSDSLAHWVYVEILAQNEDSYSVAADKSRNALLSEGDAVIISGNLNLADKSRVEIAR